MKKCPKCGKEIEGNFCPECGSELKENVCSTNNAQNILNEYQNIVKSKPKNIDANNSVRKIIEIIVLVLVLVGLLVIVCYKNSNTDYSEDYGTDDYNYQEETYFSFDNYAFVNYEDLQRYPDDYKGQKIRGEGKVYQVIEDSEIVYLRVGSSDLGKMYYLAYESDFSNGRIIEDDYVGFYGTYAGLYTYESVGGEDITLPAVYCDRIYMNGNCM